LSKSDKKIKLSIIGSVGLPASYGGWETLVDNIINYIGNKFDITVFCSSKIYKKKIYKYKNVKLSYVNLYPNGFQSILYDAISLYRSNKFADFTLVLGVSGAIFIPFIKSNKNKIIINLDGIEWKRSKWGYFTKIFLRISEFFAVKFADSIITDNKAISDYILHRYNRKSSQISYGGDHAKKIILKKNLAKKYNIVKHYAFKVCRIEPENNIELVLNAFIKTELPLVIVGNWESSEYGRRLKKTFSRFSNINILDSIYDQSILNQIRSNAFLYIHGHSVGGTNPSLVEAMFLGLPVFAYDVSFNRHTTENKCLYFKSENELSSLILKTNKNSIHKIGYRMKQIASKKYKWRKIANQYLRLFNNTDFNKNLL
jgi:glycosyltransferase involved in cell wall biosynthesis